MFLFLVAGLKLLLNPSGARVSVCLGLMHRQGPKPLALFQPESAAQTAPISSLSPDQNTSSPHDNDNCR